MNMFICIENKLYLDGSNFVVHGSYIVMILKQYPLHKIHIYAKVKQIFIHLEASS
jgi:energy-converting hydrogenase Eha subunit C